MVHPFGLALPAVRQVQGDLAAAVADDPVGDADEVATKRGGAGGDDFALLRGERRGLGELGDLGVGDQRRSWSFQIARGNGPLSRRFPGWPRSRP